MKKEMVGFFSQRVISELCGVAVSTVNRHVGSHEIQHEMALHTKIKKYSIETTRKICSDIYSGTRKIRKKIHVFYNFKGGTGKTSICYQTACHLALLGYRVLAIDLDPQGHLSRSLHFKENEQNDTIYDCIIHGRKMQDVIQNVFFGLDAVPSNLGLTRIEVPLSQRTRREELLKKALLPIKDNYDFILIDTNPTISMLNMNALVASGHVNIVCETQPYSLAGLGMLLEEIEKFFKDMQLPLSYKIVANKYESKTATAQEVLGSLRLDYKDAIMDTVIRKSEDINISTKKNLPISWSAPKKSMAFEDLRDFIHELVKVST